jgi:hypothetical protein
MPLLPCPHCDQKVLVAISQAGTEVTCQGCQQSIRVPKLGELKKIAADEAQQSGASDVSSTAGTTAADQTGRRIIFGGLLAICGVAAVAGLFCLVRYLSVEVPATTEMHIAEIERLYRESPAAQLVREWQQMENYNLEASGPYLYKKLEKEKSRWARNSLIAGGVLVLAASSAVILGLGDRRRRTT